MGVFKSVYIKTILEKFDKNHNMNKIDYSEITETPGLKATQEQITRLYHRYHFARQFAKEKDVLEVACGSGIGLGYLAQVANKVVGGDIDEKNVTLAQRIHKYKQNVSVKLLDAHDLPFDSESFDVILLYEAIYYLKSPDKFISEAKRVLKKGGHLIICTVNKDWKDFHPSPYTYKYFSVPELYRLLQEGGFVVKNIYGAFPIEKGFKSQIISIIKRMAVKFDLIPGSLAARAYLKRIFMGELKPLPEEVYEGMAPYEEPTILNPKEINREFKIIYAVGKK